jgi:hypothetical protein
VPAMLPDDPGDNAQPQPRAFFLGGVKGIENFFDGSRRNARSVVGYTDFGQLPVRRRSSTRSWMSMAPPPDMASQALTIRLTSTSLN